jgi:hypothetical protein
MRQAAALAHNGPDHCTEQKRMGATEEKRKRRESRQTTPGRRCLLRPGFGDQARRSALLMSSRLSSGSREVMPRTAKGRLGRACPPAQPAARKGQRPRRRCTAQHSDRAADRGTKNGPQSTRPGIAPGGSSCWWLEPSSPPLPLPLPSRVVPEHCHRAYAYTGRLKNVRTGWYATAHRRLHRCGLPHGGLSSAAAVHATDARCPRIPDKRCAETQHENPRIVIIKYNIGKIFLTAYMQ